MMAEDLSASARKPEHKPQRHWQQRNAEQKAKNSGKNELNWFHCDDARASASQPLVLPPMHCNDIKYVGFPSVGPSRLWKSSNLLPSLWENNGTPKCCRCNPDLHCVGKCTAA